MASEQLIHLTWSDIQTEAGNLARRHAHRQLAGVYGIPRGGCVPAAIVAGLLDLPIVHEPGPDVLVVDDLVDSGSTAREHMPLTFDALYRKPHSPRTHAPDATEQDGWLVFPWETNELGPENAVQRLLEWIGEDPTRDGLVDTPKRVIKALRQMTEGYAIDPFQDLAVTFDVECDQMIVLSNIAFASTCEHHMLPFIGHATVGYIPDGPIVGLSKLARVVDAYSQRLQVQERLTDQIADAIEQALAPKGVGVIVTAHHSCMGLRGVKKPGARMTTSSLRGRMKDDGVVRAEFMALHQLDG